MGIILVDNGETMREVEGLALGDQGSNLGPRLRLSGIREEVHDNCSSVDSLLDGEEGLSRYLIRHDQNYYKLTFADKLLTQPSSIACFQLSPFSRTPTMTFKPLSRAFKP